MNNPKDYTFELSDRPDGFGYYYGHIRKGDENYNINVLPPKTQWVGDIEPDGKLEPDPELFILYVDGEEIDRVRILEDITVEKITALLPSPDET